MAISIASPSVALNLTSNESDVVSIASQEKGFVKAAIADVTGMLNGGSTAAVGLASTVMTVAKVGAGIAIANRTDFTKNFPVIGLKQQ